MGRELVWSFSVCLKNRITQFDSAPTHFWSCTLTVKRLAILQVQFLPKSLTLYAKGKAAGDCWCKSNQDLFNIFLTGGKNGRFRFSVSGWR